MLSNEMPVLLQLINAATGWQTAANGVGVTIKQLNAVLPDNSIVVLYWDTTHSLWNVDTSLA